MSKAKSERRIPIVVKLIVMLIISLAAASVVFYVVHQAGNFLVWRDYLNENSKQERAEQYVERFQDYVTKHKLTVSDSEMIQKWSGGDYVDILVYKDANLVYAPEWFKEFQDDELGDGNIVPPDKDQAGDEYGETEAVTGSQNAPGSSDKPGSSGGEEMDDTSFYENLFSGDRGFEQYLTEDGLKAYRTALEDALSGNEKLHPVYFVDGTMLVAVVDYSDELMGNIVFTVALISGFAAMALIMIAYFTSIVRRIRLLSENVSVVERGNLDHEIKERGNDEIAHLAKDVESMRDSIVDNMTKERRAWEANVGLITSMSHDIRTPLTVLSGYLDLIEHQNKDGVNEEYIHACKDNVLRLKNLSDDMFSYFLVFGKGGAELDPVPVDIGKGLSHSLAEYAILLSEKGYELESSPLPSVTVKIDEKYFRRVIDNLFSNIVKYADPSSPVRFAAQETEDMLILSCTNSKKQGEERAESNGIGHKTCIRIMEEMGGSFEVGETDEIYTVTIKIVKEDSNDS